MRRKLSSDEYHGDVSVCGQCQDIHIRWDNLMLSLRMDQFEAFARMVGAARVAALAQEPGSFAGYASVREALVQ